MSGRRRRLHLVLVSVASGLALLLGGYSIASYQVLSDSEAERADAAIGAAEDLCTQVEQSGRVCVVNPSDLQGSAGPAGQDGRSITDASCIGGLWRVTYSDGQIDYDAGACTGEPGTDGQDGSVGPSGAAGQDGGDSTVPGPQGADGSDGSDGRGITDAQCNAESGRWELTYSDGTTDEDAGPCYSEPGPLG